jgi:arylsulfatase B
MVRCVSLQAHVRLLLVALALCLGAAAAGKVNKPQLSKKQPHILLVLVDDWGWGNVGYNAGSGAHPKATTSDEVRTPNIDRLAKKEGLILRRSYVYNFCSPSRAALQTGRYPTHVSVDNAEPISVNPADPIGGWAGAPPKMTGIAEKLRGAGYATAMTGVSISENCSWRSLALLWLWLGLQS